ncbi:MAG TPA: hypothetical protein VFJ74_08975 [Gemmatimonadaceae bacterium]|nr:hypothetical protein [Gemmatimonadaceae bacterium]
MSTIKRIGRGLLAPRKVWNAAERAIAVRRFRRALLASPPLPEPRGGTAEIHTIASRRTALEAIGTVKSFNRFLEEPLPVVVHDDGTLRDVDIRRISRHLPGSRVVRRDEADREVEAALARRGLERCLDLRRNLVFALKLFDVPFYAGGRPVLYTDTDILYFQPPEAIIGALNSGESRYNQDVHPGYAWPAEVIAEKLGIRLEGDVNAGLLVLHDLENEWEFFERCLATLPTAAALYYVEQTLNAILMARRAARPLPPEYDVCFRACWQPPSYDEWLRHARGSEAVASEHYCGGVLQRHWYYRHFVSRVAPALAKR